MEETQGSSPSWWSSLALSAAYQALLLTLLLGSIASHRGSLSLEFVREILVNWDARHYVRIAEYGYDTTGEHAPLIVFFPGYPFLIRLVSTLTRDFVVAGLLISSLCSIVAHAVFIQYAVRVTGSRTSGYRAAALFFCSPIAVACTLVYTEPLYLLALSVVMLGVLRQRTFFALGGVILCTLTRLVGLLSAGPLLMYLFAKRPKSYGLIGFSLIVCLGAALIYPLINFSLFDDPLRFLTYQREHWSKAATNPITQWWSISSEVLQGVFPPDPWVRMDYLVTLIAPVLLVSYLPYYIRSGATLPFSWWMWAAAQWGIVASQTFWLSSSRYLFACLPLYIIMEKLIPRNPLLFGSIVGLFLVLTLCAFLQAGTGGWLF